MGRGRGAPVSTLSWRPRVGDRIRVRPGVGTVLDCSDSPHFPEECGRTGKIVDVQSLSSAPGHPFLVVFSEPCPWVLVGRTRVRLATRHYAAGELQSAT